jgi:hypothetical protein
MSVIVATQRLSRSRSAGCRAVDDGVARRRGGLDPRHHRPERRGQDDLLQSVVGLRRSLSAGTISLGARDITGLSAAAHRAARHGAKLSDQQHLHAPQRLGQRQGLARIEDRAALSLLVERRVRRPGSTTARQRAAGRRRTRCAIAASWPSSSPTAASARSSSRSRSRKIPRSCLLDEPTAGMGTEDVARISRLIARVAQGAPSSWSSTTSASWPISRNRITVLQRGRVLVEGTYERRCAAISASSMRTSAGLPSSVLETRGSTRTTMRATCCAASTCASSAAKS